MLRSLSGPSGVVRVCSLSRPSQRGVCRRCRKREAPGSRRLVSEKGESTHRWPEFLLGSDAGLLSIGMTATNWTSAQVAGKSLGGGARRSLFQGATQPRYASSGHMMCAQGKPDGRAVRSPTATGDGRGGPRGGGCPTIQIQRSDPKQRFCRGITGLCFEEHSVGSANQAGVGPLQGEAQPFCCC
jgi:hypothetical protein